MKKIDCDHCGTSLNVSDDVVSGVCWQCLIDVVKSLEAPVKKKLVGYPKGWRFMKEFVHSDGTVYHKGVEQPDLKGTMNPTIIEEKPKKTKQQKKAEKSEALLEYAKLKKELGKETRKTHIKKLQTKLNKLQKLI